MQCFVESHRPRERYSLFRYRKGDRPPMPSIPDVSPLVTASLHRKRLAHDSFGEGEMWLRGVFD
jgi:hypothetical protein